MSDPFPPELIDSILSNLCGTPTIRECALVCTAWVPSARRHLLPHPRILVLDQIGIVNLLAVTNSPHSTLKSMSIITLYLRHTILMDSYTLAPHHPTALSDLDLWRKNTAVSKFLEKSMSTSSLQFLGIESLDINCVDWKTLSPNALIALNTQYTSVKNLSLSEVEITFPELLNMIANLLKLETLTIGEDMPFDEPWSVPIELNHPMTQKLEHKTLSRLIFEICPPLWMIQAMCKAIHYAAGIVEVSIDGSIVGLWWEIQESCEELFSTAGASLQTVKLRASDRTRPRTISSINQSSSLASFLSFPHNPNLHEIHLWDVNDDALGGFIRGFTSNPKPHLRTLKLGLAELKYLEEWKDTWELVDRTLSSLAAISRGSSSAVKDHQFILEYSSSSKLESHRVFTLPGHEEEFLKVQPVEALHMVMGVLPRTAETWTINVEICR